MFSWLKRLVGRKEEPKSQDYCMTVRVAPDAGIYAESRRKELAKAEHANRLWEAEERKTWLERGLERERVARDRRKEQFKEWVANVAALEELRKRSPVVASNVIPFKKAI